MVKDPNVESKRLQTNKQGRKTKQDKDYKQTGNETKTKGNKPSFWRTQTLRFALIDLPIAISF